MANPYMEVNLDGDATPITIRKDSVQIIIENNIFTNVEGLSKIITTQTYAELVALAEAP